MLKLSSAAVELIKKQQGLSLEKYRDEHGTEVLGMVTLFSNGRSSMVLLPLLKQSAC